MTKLRQVYFSLNGVWCLGELVCQPVAVEDPDPLLAELSWPPGSVLVTNVRLATFNTPIAACMVIPREVIQDLNRLEGEG